MLYRASRFPINWESLILSFFLTFLTFQVLVRDLPSLITGRLYTKYQNLPIKTKKDDMCWFILQVSWLINTYWGWKTTDICAFKIYHAGPSNNISERRLYHACGFYSVGELQVINLSSRFCNKYFQVNFQDQIFFQDPDRGWRTYWGILWLHRGCDQFKSKCS